jgi:hypothetical protein
MCIQEVSDGHYLKNSVNDSNITWNIYFIRVYNSHLKHYSFKYICKNIFRPSSKMWIRTYIR